jgi:hypothetical protein
MFPPYPGNEFEQIPSRHDAGAGKLIKTTSSLTAAIILPFGYIIRTVPCQDNLSGSFIGGFSQTELAIV